jgi:hypothetical protein
MIIFAQTRLILDLKRFSPDLNPFNTGPQMFVSQPRRSRFTERGFKLRYRRFASTHPVFNAAELKFKSGAQRFGSPGNRFVTGRWC